MFGHVLVVVVAVLLSLYINKIKRLREWVCLVCYLQASYRRWFCVFNWALVVSQHAHEIACQWQALLGWMFLNVSHRLWLTNAFNNGMFLLVLFMNKSEHFHYTGFGHCIRIEKVPLSFFFLLYLVKPMHTNDSVKCLHAQNKVKRAIVLFCFVFFVFIIVIKLSAGHMASVRTSK